MKVSNPKLVKDEMICAANILSHGCRLGIAKIDSPTKKIGGIPAKKRAVLAKELEDMVVD